MLNKRLIFFGKKKLMKLFTCFTIIFKLSVAIRIADILLNKKESPLNLNNVNQFSVSVKKNIFQKKLMKFFTCFIITFRILIVINILQTN